MNSKNISIIVIGGLNTDIVAQGARKLLLAGEHTYVDSLKIGPGGKSRNMAQMIAALMGKDQVAMIGKTAKDPYGFWKVPLDALKKANVNTQYVTVDSNKKGDTFPGIALIPVDKDGKNQIYVIPGINNDFLPRDIENSFKLFESVSQNNGLLVLSLELPLQTAIFAIKKANKLGIKVLFDPGGIDETQDYTKLLNQKIFLIKPNEHEIKILTGIHVTNYKTAKKAAQKLLQKEIENVFITAGKTGGYLFNKNVEVHIPVPSTSNNSIKDETGCGDQTIAAIAYALNEGKTIEEASKIGILAGTLQFHKQGIVPITKQELNRLL